MLVNIAGTLKSIFSIGESSSKASIRSNSGTLEGKNFGGTFSKMLLGGNNLNDVSSANTSLNNLLPSQSSNSGKVLYTNGTDSSWQNVGSLPNKSTTFVRRNTTQNITGGVLTKVQFNNTLKDSQTEWDGTNFRWVSEKAQDILVTANTVLTGMGNNRQLEVLIYVDGSVVVGNSATNSNTGNDATYASASHMLSVSIGTYVEVYVQHSDGNNTRSLTSSYLSIKEI